MTQYLLSVPQDSHEEPTAARASKALGGGIEVRAFQEAPGT